MSECRIYKSEYDQIPCDNWPCLGQGKSKYFVGDPNSHVPKMVLCEDCVSDLVGNIPAELEAYLPEPEAVNPEPGERKPVYKCHQCEESFDSPQKLGLHKRKHPQKRVL